jgi:hypothetical protein
MRAYFSKRHADALRDKKLLLTFAKPLRVSLLRILENHSDYGGWNNAENWTVEAAENSLKTFFGKDHLSSFNDQDQRVRSNFSGVVRGGYPSEVLDAIEAWFDQHPEREDACERELNDCFNMNGSPWRIVNGEAFLIDSEYLHVEVRARTLRLLRQGRAFGALEEFQAAVQDLQAGDTKDSVVKAHKSVESVMKTALATTDHLTFGALLARLIDSGLVPEYYKEFFIHFEKLALGAVKERNRPGTGHGQGQASTEVPRSLAEFAVNLAATINLFIIQRWMERYPTKSKDVATPHPNDEVPF